jgi:hypothetical protein
VKEETSEMIHLECSFYGAETWTLWKADQKYLESFENIMLEKKMGISWTDRVRKVVQRVKKGGGGEYPTNNKKKQGPVCNWETPLNNALSV